MISVICKPVGVPEGRIPGLPVSAELFIAPPAEETDTLVTAPAAPAELSTQLAALKRSPLPVHVMEDISLPLGKPL